MAGVKVITQEGTVSLSASALVLVSLGGGSGAVEAARDRL
jgi:hypothetical protein